jgi:hypothetical protein
MLAADEATAKSHAQGFGLAPKLTVTFGPKTFLPAFPFIFSSQQSNWFIVVLESRYCYPLVKG